ncbi:MAG: hypothetical protein AVDCRST_MAG75-3, partial [uncultured Propionibacteriaceae bacterium]
DRSWHGSRQRAAGRTDRPGEQERVDIVGLPVGRLGSEPRVRSVRERPHAVAVCPVRPARPCCRGDPIRALPPASDVGLVGGLAGGSRGRVGGGLGRAGCWSLVRRGGRGDGHRAARDPSQVQASLV